MCAVQIIMITGCQTGVFFSFFWESGGEIENPWMTFAVNSDGEAGMDRYTSKLSPAVDYGAGTFLLVVGKCCFFTLLLKNTSKVLATFSTLNYNPLNYT